MRPESREKAHLALRPLWEAADIAIRTSGNTREVTLPSGQTMKSLDTENGATIVKLGDTLLVNALFEKSDGTDEDIRIRFPEDTRDLSESEVEIEWSNSEDVGVETPPLKRYPELAKDLLGLIQ
jgi:hypothetical protein